MSSSLSEFLSAWNETFPLQIREAELKNPTESIFRRLLISMLKQFYVETFSFDNMDNESGPRLRASRVKLVATVNHFYKIAFPGAKQDFCYMDLIQPNFKKSFNVLNYLLNYCNFIRHTYNSTVADLKDQIAERDELRSIRSHLRKEIEETKIKEENNVKAMKEFDLKIPRQVAKLNELKEGELNLKNEKTKLEIDFEKMEMKLMEIKNEIAALKTMGVSDQEVESIVSAKESIEKQLEEQDQITSAGRHKLKENSRAIDEALATTTKMEAIYSSFNNIDAIGAKNQKKQVENLQLEVNALNSSIAQNSSVLSQTRRHFKMKEKILVELTKNRDEVKKTYNANILEQKQSLSEMENLLRNLSNQEAAHAATHHQICHEQELTFKIASNVLKHISTKIFTDDRFQN